MDGNTNGNDRTACTVIGRYMDMIGEVRHTRVALRAGLALACIAAVIIAGSGRSAAVLDALPAPVRVVAALCAVWPVRFASEAIPMGVRGARLLSGCGIDPRPAVNVAAMHICDVVSCMFLAAMVLVGPPAVMPGLF